MKRLFAVVLALNIVLLAAILFFDTPADPNHAGIQVGRDSDHTLLLLSERATQAPESSGRGSNAKKSIAPSTSVGERVEEYTCYTLGPFSRPEDAIGAVMQLKARELDARARKRDETVAAGYMAFVPPQKTRAEARATLRTLHQQGVDSFIVTQGDKNNAISVGIYSDLAQAQARQAELRAKGYQIVVEPRGTLKQEHWVDIKGKKEVNVVSEVEKSLATDFASLRLERQKCR